VTISSNRKAQAINALPGELLPAFAGFTLFLCLFGGYFMLRPIREAMGIQAGVDNLQWLFTATFVLMLVAVPLFGWLNSVVPRAQFLDWVYGIFALHLAGFALTFALHHESVWLTRTRWRRPPRRSTFRKSAASSGRQPLQQHDPGAALTLFAGSLLVRGTARHH
jgi:AAA family ATP:ADP antiporter